MSNAATIVFCLALVIGSMVLVFANEPECRQGMVPVWDWFQGWVCLVGEKP